MAVRDPITGRFLSGSSGNPTGRPVGSLNLTTLLREALLETDSKDRKTRAQLVVLAVIGKALEGDCRAAELLFDRIDGPIAQQIQDGGIDLQTIAKLMQAKRDSLRGPAGGPAGTVS